MKLLTDESREFILISAKEHLDELMHRINDRMPFACKFKFATRNLLGSLLRELGTDLKYFRKKKFYHDSVQKIHISESESGYIWISTYGLIANGKATENKAVNSCLSQYMVISLLLKKALEVVQDERVYDIDSYGSELLKKLSPAIFQNLAFYIEVFCKAYLSLTGNEAPRGHKLSLLYKKTVDKMVIERHDDSLLQILVLDPLYKFVDHLTKIPGDFREQFIKYDDNPLDDTIIIFEHEGLFEMSSILDLSIDFITDYFHIGTKTHYLESNIYQRMLDRADTEEKKKIVQELYPHLAHKMLTSQAVFKPNASNL